MVDLLKLQFNLCFPKIDIPHSVLIYLLLVECTIVAVAFAKLPSQYPTFLKVARVGDLQFE